MKYLLLKLLLVNASFLANEAQSQNLSSEIKGKRPRSLDSLTPGVVFEKLPAVRADATIAKMDAVLDLGELRSGKNYEVEVNLVNNRSEPLKPVRATTSCNCVVGSIESLEILPGKQGSLFLRFRAGEQDLKHLARLEFDGQLFFDINLKGKVKLGFASSHDSIILEGLHGKQVEITLAANFADIDITTVHVEPTYGYLKVKSVEAKEDSAVITLVEGETKWVSSARELLEVNYCLRDAKSVAKSQRVDLAINSNVVFARPRMLRMQTTHCIESEDYLSTCLPGQTGILMECEIGLCCVDGNGIATA